MPSAVDRRPARALALMVASGFAGLAYQIVWTQQSSVWLGHESAAVLAVVAAFFGGLGVGAWTLGSRIERSCRPQVAYAVCEVVVAVWSLVLALLLEQIAGALLRLLGTQPLPMWQWSVAFVGTFLLLLPATVAMGATLPAMARVIDIEPGRSSVAALYAANTVGAVLGVLAAAFWLVPGLGLRQTGYVCAALNLLCAVAALSLRPGVPGVATGPSAAAPTSKPHRALLALAATGLLGIGYEVLVVRVLSQVSENTVYTFAMLLAVYLVGTAAGAAAYAHVTRNGTSTKVRGDGLLVMLAASCLLGTATLWGAETIKAAVVQAWGANLASALSGEAALAVLAFLPPTLVMGALFSHLSAQARACGVGLGPCLGVNTLGAALAPLVFGILVLPLAGAKAALLAIAVGYLLLQSRLGWKSAGAWGTTGAIVAMAIWAPALTFVDLPEGGRIVSYREGLLGAVSVVEDADGVARLRINNRAQEGSSATLPADARQAMIPLLLHPAPHRALFLGLGTGVTASSAAQDAQLQVDAVELLPEVIEASRHFTQTLVGASGPPPIRLLAADARRFVRASDQRYDLIIADNFHPARSGSAALYTVEHFRSVRARLAAGGLFCQWLPLHQLDLPTLRSIVASFLVAYPGGRAVLATHSLQTPVLGLMGTDDDRSLLRVGQVRTRISSAALPQPPSQFGLDDEYALLGSFVAGPAALARFASGAVLNSDDRPVVAYLAPRITYVPESQPRDRLLALLSELDIEPDELIEPGAIDSESAARLAGYWKARKLFLQAGRDVKADGDVRRMLSQVQGPLLQVLQLSPDFRPAYDPLLRMAVALGRNDPVGASALLDALVRVQPGRPEAAQALVSLAARP